MEGNRSANAAEQLGSDPKELKQFLARVNCQHYYGKFVENGITFDLLPELDSNSLKELGVAKLGDRLRMEIAISNLKAEALNKLVPIDDLCRSLAISSPNSTVNIADYAITNDSTLVPSDSVGSSVSRTLLNMSSASSLAGLGGETKNANKNISFILADGSLKKVNVTNCFNAQSIKRKVLRKLGIKAQENSYDTYIHATRETVNLLFDVELVTICYSPDRLEKHRIMLVEKNQYPTDAALEVSEKIMAKYESLSKPARNLNQYRLAPAKAPNMRNFFGQRPPSELISSNLAEYFPEAHHKDLEASVRNSVRYSARLSRRFQFPHDQLGSSTSINRRASAATVRGKAPSIVSIENHLSSQRFPTGKTIGEVMVNNVASIEEAVNPDNQSVFSKPPSIQSDTNSTSGIVELKSIISSNSGAGRNPRISVATSFVDAGAAHEDNRYSRIELLSVESDEDQDDYYDDDDDFLSAYADDPFADMASQDGPQNWLKGACIGTGSFGTVYLGMNPFTGELMAVKQVSYTQNSEAQKAVVEVLQHETALLKNLNHENIVRYLGSSTDVEHLNIFLEYVPGGSVQSMLSSYGPFEEPLIRNFVRQVLIGLSYLHGEDIIHRDIKGANILIDIKGTVKISDFGISKKVGTNHDSEEDKKTGRRASLQGSVYWMAPEVVKQTAYTKKADIWSVGCLVVEMFTGKHPFPNFSQMQAIFKIGTHVAPEIPEWCTAEAKEFLRKTFELDYNDRPAAVELLAEPFLNQLIMSKQ